MLSVGAYFGGLCAVAIIWAHRMLIDEGDWHVPAVSLLFRWLLIPSLSAVLLLGLLLFVQHPGAFWRLRWLRLKLLVLLLTIPPLHLTMRPLLTRIKAHEATAGAQQNSAEVRIASRRFAVGLGLAVAVTAGVIGLGRHKPRLGLPVSPASPRGDKRV